jgi:hypothetical protein
MSSTPAHVQRKNGQITISKSDGWCRSPEKLKIYFCSDSNGIIWYPLEGSIRTKTPHSKGNLPCR